MVTVESRRAAAPPVVRAATLGLAAACWAVAAWLMDGMDMGVATRPGSFGFFAAAWVTMMAAMMLPGAAPAVARRARMAGTVRAALPFVAYYLPIWALAGVVAYALDRPHGSLAAGAGLMAMLVALDVMSLFWMAVVAVLCSAQKLLPAKAAIDVPVALVIFGLGLVIVCAPSLVPGLTPPAM
jgi:predicted metal-binding membrane protein